MMMLQRSLIQRNVLLNTNALYTGSRALLYQSTQFQNKKQLNEESPEKLVLSSHLNSKPQDYVTKVKIVKRPKSDLLTSSKYESSTYQLPKWKEALGEIVIKTFHLDMDKVRAGAIAGSYYYSLCRNQGLQYENESLSETANFFYEDLKLPRTFSQWFQITILHEWILFVRMRAMPFKYGRNYQQKLVDRTFSDIEMRLFEEMNVNTGRIADQYLKDFNSQLRGAVFAYDEGFFTDDATLATAVWRNLFGGRKNIDIVHLDAVVRYIRSQLYVLSRMSDREFATGNFKFVPPNETVEILNSQQEEEKKRNVISKYEQMDKNADLLPSEKSKLSYKN